jgi:hypothetical protein
MIHIIASIFVGVLGGTCFALGAHYERRIQNKKIKELNKLLGR